MIKTDRTGLALIITASILVMVAFAGSAFASGTWGELSITLKPGESATVEFTNTENTVNALDIVNISAPDLVPYVVASPDSMGALATENVTISFVSVPQSILDNMAKENNYAVLVEGLIVYLDLTGETPSENENAYNLAILTSRVDSLEAALTAFMAEARGDISDLADWLATVTSAQDGLVFRITALENVEAENWAEEIQNVRAWWDARLDELEAIIPENSPSDNSSTDWTPEIEAAKVLLRTEFAARLAKEEARHDAKMAEVTAGTESTMQTYLVVAVGAMVGLVAIMFKLLWKKPEPTPAVPKIREGQVDPSTMEPEP